MLTRLKVSGFKNLLDLDVHFGPFTCVAGVNGAGKSNLFDAVRFLGALADRSLVEAAQSVRASGGGRATDIESLFFRAGSESVAEMSFTAEMIVPGQAVDDLGQTARPSITFVQYSLGLGRREDGAGLGRLGPLEIRKEELIHINLGEAYKHLPFPHRAATWRRSAVAGLRRAPFISTEDEGGKRVVTVHQDGGGGGPRGVEAQTLPRTVLSAASAAENPTALVARREMQSWRLLQLEPSCLREPDDLGAPTSLGANGAHLVATLAYLAGAGGRQETDGGARPAAPRQVYEQVAARLADLVEDVGEVRVDADEKRELLTLLVSDRAGTTHAARALSDGTLRFLALAVLEIDPRAAGLLCLEEPENGIHPARIPAMLRLLQEIPTDVESEVGGDNPLRQVIVNTHSPAVVAQVPDDSLLLAEPREVSLGGRRAPSVAFRCLAGTWRAQHQARQRGGRRGGAAHDEAQAEQEDGPRERQEDGPREGGEAVSRGQLMEQLNPILQPPRPDGRRRRGAERDEQQLSLPVPG